VGTASRCSRRGRRLRPLLRRSRQRGWGQLTAMRIGRCALGLVRGLAGCLLYGWKCRSRIQNPSSNRLIFITKVYLDTRRSNGSLRAETLQAQRTTRGAALPTPSSTSSTKRLVRARLPHYSTVRLECVSLPSVRTVVPVCEWSSSACDLSSDTKCDCYCLQ
jgi:hypothetical protein